MAFEAIPSIDEPFDANSGFASSLIDLITPKATFRDLITSIWLSIAPESNVNSAIVAAC